MRGNPGNSGAGHAPRTLLKAASSAHAPRVGLAGRLNRFSLSAELRSETGREALPRLSREEWSHWFRAWPMQKQDNGRYAGRGALLIGPGGCGTGRGPKVSASGVASLHALP